MKKLLLLLCVLLAGCIHLFAQQRSEQEAMQIAQGFFEANGNAIRLSIVQSQKVKSQVRRRLTPSKDGTAISSSFYVVNDETNDRFVIVSSDERFYDILGFSNNGIFVPESAPPALLELLEGYNAELDYLKENASGCTTNKPRRTYFPSVEPLIKSKWGQQSPYWDWCPYNLEKNTEHPCVTGCVATALAQVMNYYKYPEYGQNSSSYTTSFGTTLSIDYDTVHFEWNKICDTYNYYYDDNGEYQRASSRSAEEQREVAKLMKVCGVSVAMGYGVGLSGAYSQDLVTALIKYFKYNPNILYKSMADYSAEDWDNMIIQDLQAGHPILYSGNEGYLGSGHQFILDGCNSNGMYHFNFGWSGRYDGYFMLRGNEALDYKYGQSMVYQITPELYGIHEDYNISSFEIDKINVTVGDECQFSLGADYARSGVRTDAIPFNGQIGLGLYDTEYNFIDSLYSEKVVAGTSYKSIYNKSFHIDETIFSVGKEYIIASFSKASESVQPSLIRNDDGSITYYTAKRTDNIIHLCPQGKEISYVSGVYKVEATDQNGKHTEWYSRVDLSSKSSDYDFTFYNIDPSASKKDNSRMCQVSGELSRDGTQLKLSKYVYYGAEVGLMNYSNIKDDLIMYINPSNGQLTINDAWGAVLKSDSTLVSKYTNTVLTPVSQDELELTVADNVAGDLVNRIPSEIRRFIISLTITGTVNGNDVKLIRELSSTGSLSYINLYDARIVEGGDAYYKEYQTQNNVIGEYMFSDCDVLKKIILPSHITAIGKDAFYDSDRLESLILPDGIKVIPSFAISYCDDLSYLSIPSSVELISDYSLSNSRSIKRIDCYVRNVESLKESSSSWSKAGELRAFKDVPENCEWHVISGLSPKYEAQSWWKDTWTIVDDLPMGLQMGDSNADGEIDVADVMSIANYIMSQPLPTFVFETSDMDKDGVVDVVDISLVVNVIMSQTPSSSARKMSKAARQTSAEIKIAQEENDLVVSVVNNNRYVAAQFDICLSDEVDIQSIYAEVNSVSLHCQRIGDTTYRVVMFSTNGSSIIGPDRKLLRITLPSRIMPFIDNALFVTEQGDKHNMMCASENSTNIIETIQVESTSEVFTIDGRRVIIDDVSKLTNGLYIINGKKYIAR